MLEKAQNIVADIKADAERKREEKEQLKKNNKNKPNAWNKNVKLGKLNKKRNVWRLKHCKRKKML